MKESRRMLFKILVLCHVLFSLTLFSSQRKSFAAGDSQEKPSLEVQRSLDSLFKEIGDFFEKSMLVILPSANGKLLLGKTTSFSTDSARFLKGTKALSMDQIGPELVRLTRGNVEYAYHLFVIAQEDIRYSYLFGVVNHYQEVLKLFPQHNSLRFSVTLLQPFKDLDDLKGFKASFKGG